MAQWLSKILYSWHLGLGDLVIVQSNICPLCWEDGLVAGPVSAKPILTRILSLFWIWTPSKKGTRIMSVDYTGQSLVIGAPVGVYLVWLLGFFLSQWTEDYKWPPTVWEAAKLWEVLLPPDPRVDGCTAELRTSGLVEVCGRICGGHCFPQGSFSAGSELTSPAPSSKLPVQGSLEWGRSPPFTIFVDKKCICSVKGATQKLHCSRQWNLNCF